METVGFFKGKPISEMSREELIEVIEWLSTNSDKLRPMSVEEYEKYFGIKRFEKRESK